LSEVAGTSMLKDGRAARYFRPFDWLPTKPVSLPPFPRSGLSRSDFVLCEGFSDTGHAMTAPRPRAGVGEATRQEVALAQMVQRAPGATRSGLWGLVGATDAGVGWRVGPAGSWETMIAPRSVPSRRLRRFAGRSNPVFRCAGRTRPWLELAQRRQISDVPRRLCLMTCRSSRSWRPAADGAAAPASDREPR
jgi:hypothetical protein